MNNTSADSLVRFKQRIRQDIQSMHAYAIQDSAGMVKLDAMENPHRLPPALQAELGARLGALALNRYPDGRVNDLRRALASYAQMPEGFDIMLGNGSDELISLLAMACDVSSGTGEPAVVLAPVPGFVMYAMSAQLQGLRFVGVPLTADFELDEAAMLAAIAQHRPAIVFLAFPNNPTANLWDDSVIAKVIAAQAAQGGLVVMDEAYQPFASRSYLDVIRKDPARHAHVLLMRTLSKFGLAGVRLGYMMGAKALIAEVDKVRPPYNISVLNYECALFALEHVDVFRAQAHELIEQRAIILEALTKLPGVKSWKSDANMILTRVPDAARAFGAMKARGVLVKNVSALHPLLANCLRLTVGTVEENRLMLAALKDSL
jgi:histidinol-phosphate aminotransferase